MGVPKFFACISGRYPCLSEKVDEFQIPEFDNFYLDMNGIIHVCSHPNDLDPYFRITEEKIFSSIFHYIEVLFYMIKPRKLCFMAVDGVAPRAKMNQQRARRFMTAREAELKENEALRKEAKPLPSDRFDYNCITPGTVFMDRLHSQLKYFITNKISTDPLWQRCKVILSGHQTPGEGEHKIMEYIRYLKTLPDYDENTRHCLYGLDADLIMLGMCTHEPHFSLLREKVLFRKAQKKGITPPDEIEFQLLHLSLLREYLDLEFQELKETLPFKYNLENVIDDWVLMCFLLGNDFIPNPPDLHIRKGAVQILYKTYKEVLPTLDGYLNDNGYLNLPRFQNFLEKLAQYDLDTFEDTYANLAFLEEKTGKSFLSEKKPNGEGKRKSELEELIKATNDFLETSDEEFPDEDNDEESYTFLGEFIQHKKNYYTDKMDYSNVTPEVLRSQAEGYIRAIQWNLHYYYQGIQSWSWFYPHHYAPYISDVTNFKDLKLDFEMGKPFLPFEQLLAVLPPASKALLPEVYRELMTSPDSEIKDFYPEDFKTDLNGKQQDWEAVVLIPFIDEKRLLRAMAERNEKLTQEERRRNQHGPMHVYTYTEDNLGAYNAPEYFPSVPANHASVEDVFREEVTVELHNLKYGLRPGVSLGVGYPAFPTFEHIPHTGSITENKVKEYERFSKGEIMVLKLKKSETPPIEALANGLLGKIIYVNWPHLIESRAIAISNGEVRYKLTQGDGIECEVLSKQDLSQWTGEGESLATKYLALGIDIGPVDVIVHVATLEGRKYLFGPMGKITNEKIWSSVPTPHPLQVVVKDVNVNDHRSREYVDFKDAFPVNSTVFMLGQPHFGCRGRVVDSSECYRNSRLNVELTVVNDPVLPKSFTRAEQKFAYVPSRVAASKAGISPRLLSRLTGSVLVSMTNKTGFGDLGSMINIGLSMKFSKKNEEIPGYTKRENENWLYSQKAIAVVAAFVEKFSRVVEYLSNNQDTNVFFVMDIFPGEEGSEELNEIVTWIKEQEFNKVERIKCGSSVLEAEVVEELEKMVDGTPRIEFKRRIQVKPHLLYKSGLMSGNVPPVNTAKHHLLDRVVSIRSSCTVPTGLRGFIIGIYPDKDDGSPAYDVLFDGPFLGGVKRNSTSERVFRMSKAHFLNITDGNRPRQNLPAASHVARPLNREQKISAFAQWNQQPARPAMPVNEDAIKKIWSSLQSANRQEDALKKILKIEKKETEEIQDPVKSFFESVTKGTNLATLETRPPHSAENSRNRYCVQLFSYHQSRNLGQPRFKFHNVGAKVMAQVTLKDGKVYSGLPCDDKESACESAALQALGALGEIPLDGEAVVRKEKETKILESQMRLSNALIRANGAGYVRPPFLNHNPCNWMPPFLPSPPSQWVGHGRNSQFQGLPFYPPRENFHIHQMREIPEKQPQKSVNSGSKKLNASALGFVPLQAITGKRNVGRMATVQSSQTAAEPPKKTEVVATLINNPAPSSTTPNRRRRPKIAAKLNLDYNLF